MAKVNYLITGGSLSEKLAYSVFKLLDWSVGNAVCIVHDTEQGSILINDCPLTLRQSLVEKFGGCVADRLWGYQGREADIQDVIKVVSEWVEERS